VESLQRIVSITERYSHLRPFFSQIFTEGSLFDDTAELVDLSSRLFMDVRAKLRITEIRQRLAEISKISDQLAQQSVGTLEELGGRVETLRNSYEQSFAVMQLAHQDYSKTQEQYQHASTYLEGLTQCLNAYERALAALHNTGAIMLNELARMHYTEVTAQAVALETQLGERNVLESRIAGLEEHIGVQEPLGVNCRCCSMPSPRRPGCWRSAPSSRLPSLSTR
jgi:chromosome segregation ATPase